MRHLLALGIVVLLLFAAPGGASAQQPPLDPEFQADIQRLMDLTGAARISHQISSILSQQLLDSLSKTHPNIPERAVAISKEVMEEELSKAFDGPNGLMAEMVPLYAKHFTHDEIRGLIAFYQSDIGKRAIAELPSLMQESAAVGQRWATDIGPRIQATLQERLKSEGALK